VLIVVVACGLVVAVPGRADQGGVRPDHVIVRMAPGTVVIPNLLLASVNGQVDQVLPTINGFSAYVPSGQIDRLRAVPGVLEVTEDGRLNVEPDEPPVREVRGHDVNDFVASDFSHADGGPSFDRLDLGALNEIIGANDIHAAGITGAGVDVALIDTGVAAVNGVGSTINGPDLSFDAQVPGFQYLDAYGHGTHLAGIINGNGAGITGVAPGARLVNVKVGAANGAVDVVQVIAAINWIVQHRRDNGLNIREIVLAYGTDSTQSYTIDPLAYAAEVAWRNGIVVVAAAGNAGPTAASLTDPAMDPYLLSVGAVDTNGTYTSGDDVVAPFSTWGNSRRSVDVVAPGRSLVSLRDPGSYIDQLHPEGREPDGFFRGSGTSQAAAVVAGAVALMLQAKPDLTPDQVKYYLAKTAKPLPLSDPAAQGAGEIDLRRVAHASPSANRPVQNWTVSTGTGSLEGARGSVHVVMNGVPLRGEIDIFGQPWDGQSWSGVSWSGVSWSGVSWSGVSWSGQSWSGVSWSGVSWSGVSWSGVSWSGVSWSGVSWSGVSWSGTSP